MARACLPNHSSCHLKTSLNAASQQCFKCLKAAEWLMLRRLGGSNQADGTRKGRVRSWKSPSMCCCCACNPNAVVSAVVAPAQAARHPRGNRAPAADAQAKAPNEAQGHRGGAVAGVAHPPAECACLGRRLSPNHLHPAISMLGQLQSPQRVGFAEAEDSSLHVTSWSTRLCCAS